MLISNGGGHADGKLGRTVRALLVSMVVRRQAKPTVKLQNRDDLVALKELVETGAIKPVIDGTYPLSETRKAIERVASGRTRGTIVISVRDADVRVASRPVPTEVPVATPVVA
jgi:NADPH:quinone reductase-like Zn-dependent oxidoreductase